VTIFDAANPKHVRAAERLESDVPIWLTTVAPKGQPQTSPVWFWWDGDVFHVFSKPDAPKVRNIGENPRVSLHLNASETADDDVVIFEGIVEIDPAPVTADRFPAYVKKYRGLIDSYGWTPEGMVAEYSVGLRITPTRIRVDDD
jgi:PPOX class probable F420-dependent enzyme